MPSSHGILPDSPLTAPQQAVADSLSSEVVAEIDAALLSHATKTLRKVAMLVGLTMMDESVLALRLPDVYYAQRVKVLVRSGLLVAEGNLDYMRHSEVRLP